MSLHPEEPPFKDHRRYYMLVKVAIVLIVAVLAARFLLSQSMSP